MNRFDYISAASEDEARASIGPDALVFAGGTDLLTRAKLGLVAADTLVDVKRAGLPSTIERTDDALSLGALVTLADLERASLPEWAGALVEAAAQAATPQIRERATVGGNLLQRPRCWYFRDPEVMCWLKGGDGCPARDGRNEHHAVLPATHPSSSPCVAVHPSDLASTLLALDASVRVRSQNGERTLSLTELLQAPEADRRREHTLGDDELLIAIRVPTPPDGTRSLYLKAMERKVWAFALVGLAASARVDGDRLHEPRLVASGIGNVPIALDALAAELDGGSIDEALSGMSIRRAMATLEPLSENAYKPDLLERLVRSALRQLVG